MEFNLKQTAILHTGYEGIPDCVTLVPDCTTLVLDRLRWIHLILGRENNAKAGISLADTQLTQF
jgi:hypothetical protein